VLPLLFCGGPVLLCSTAVLLSGLAEFLNSPIFRIRVSFLPHFPGHFSSHCLHVSFHHGTVGGRLSVVLVEVEEAVHGSLRTSRIFGASPLGVPVSSSHYCINIASSFDLKLPRVNSWLQGLYSTERVLAVSQIGDAGNLKFSNSVDIKKIIT